jgi:hypothetical protein
MKVSHAGPQVEVNLRGSITQLTVSSKIDTRQT